MAGQLWQQLYLPSSFEWIPNITPFSNLLYPIFTCLAYYAIIFILWVYMKNKNGYSLSVAFTIHNIILCIWSFVMCFGMITDIIPMVQQNGIFWLVCDDKNVKVMKGRLWYWAYIYYLSKYYELFDTILLVLKKKPLTFLHVYHHSIIVVLSWSWLQGDWPLCWWGIAFNTLIHIIMYYYYAASIWGYKFWWKKYITSLQLTQFFSVFINIWIFLFVSMQYSNVWQWGDMINFDKSWNSVQGYCAGDLRTVVFSQIVNITFILLFLNFYSKTYKEKSN